MADLLRGVCHSCAAEGFVEETDDGEYRCLSCNEVGFVERLPAQGAGQSGGGGGENGAEDAAPGAYRQLDMLNDPDVLGSAITQFFTGFTSALQDGPPGDGDRSGPVELEQLGRNMLGAVQRGFDAAASQTVGMSDQDRHWVQAQGSTVSAWAEGRLEMLRHAGPLVAFLEQHLGASWESQLSGMDEDTVRRWLDEREIPAEAVASGGDAPLNLQEGEVWTCPICYEKTHDDGLCLLCDGDGSSWHVFHKQCALTWLRHNNSCPLCRRSPIVHRPE